MRGKTTVNRADVWAVDLEPVRGSEMGKRRPCLIVSNDIANRYSDQVMIVPLTTTRPKKDYPFIVEVPMSANLPSQSWANANHLRSVSKGRLDKWYTCLDSTTMRKVDEALLNQLGIGLGETKSLAG